MAKLIGFIIGNIINLISIVVMFPLAIIWGLFSGISRASNVERNQQNGADIRALCTELGVPSKEYNQIVINQMDVAKNIALKIGEPGQAHQSSPWNTRLAIAIASLYQEQSGYSESSFENFDDDIPYSEEFESNELYDETEEQAVKNNIVANITQGVNSRISSEKVALQFVLEELDAASQGNETAVQFVKNSGFSPSEYEGAMKRSFEEVDGVNGPQQFLLSSVMQYSSDMDFMVSLRLKVVENIIHDWGLGNLESSRISNLLQSLRSILEDDASVMPALTKNIPVPTSAQDKHVHFRQKNLDSAQNIISTLSVITGDDIDTIIRNSLQKSTLDEIAMIDGGMRLEEAEVDILFIVRDNTVIYINKEADHLFEIDKDGYEKLDGRVVNFVFSGQSNATVIEVFVAFNDSDSYTMFTLQVGMVERLNYVTQLIFKYFLDTGIQNVFSLIEQYNTQYIYTFKLYRKNKKYLMVNNSQTQAYLINESTFMRDDVDRIKNIFWNEHSADQDFDDDIPF